MGNCWQAINILWESDLRSGDQNLKLTKKMTAKEREVIYSEEWGEGAGEMELRGINDKRAGNARCSCYV
jgi:hypothetical protein